MAFELWHIWVLAGLAALALEMVTPEMIVGSVGMGCFAAAVAAFAGGSMQLQLVICSIVIFVVMLGLRPFVKRVIYSRRTVQATGVQALVGRQGVILDRIAGGTEVGRVKLGGEEWRAFSESREPIEQGACVRIVGNDGASLIVKAEPDERKK